MKDCSSQDRLGIKLLFVAIVFALFLQSASAFAEPFMPEFYLASGQQYCAIRMIGENSKFSDRRVRMLGTLSSLYHITEGWKKLLTVVNVDYIEYKSFDIVVFVSCSDRRSLKVALEKVAAIEPGLKNLTIGKSPLVSRESILDENPSAAERFRLFNPSGKLDSCVVQLQAKPEDLRLASRAYTALVGAWLEFRLPLADVNLQNNGMYILLSRSCDRKREVLDALSNTIGQYGFREMGKLQPMLSPDIAGYLRVQPKVAR